ncbi:MAG: NAD(P)-binding domain-containing protein [Thermoanaerobaculia bacterium]
MNAWLELDAGAVWALSMLVVALVVLPYVAAFRRRRRADRARLDEARELGIDRPIAQYPFIDPGSCIGCGACVRACPEGDVLGVVGGVAVVINGLRCVGHARCADACPVGAIEVGLGDLKSRRDVPLLTDELETSVPGIFVAGELTGLALIRNAVEQGGAVMDTIATRVRSAGPRPAATEIEDAVIVGAGPAGLAAALRARERGLRALVVDQGEGLGGTILHFPSRKMVLTRPVSLPGGGSLMREEYSKEEVLAVLGAEIARHELRVRYGEKLEAIERAAGELRVRTGGGTYRARQVVLALGRRGTPRKLGVPGEELGKVMYQLRDAESYRGQRILVVGGGDSAIEAAIGLARQAGNRVTLSYRKRAFYRIKQKNQKAIESLVARGRVRAVFESEVESIAPEAVVLRRGGQRERLENDYVFVMIGGDPPFDLLRRLGLRFGGETPAESAGAAPAPHSSAAGPRRVTVAGLALAALAAFAVLGLGAPAPLAAQENPHGKLAIACEQCHTTGGWTPVRRDIPFRHAATGYPLVGMHAVAACRECHLDLVFSRVATACQDCHGDPHLGRLGLACQDCHDPRRWEARDDLYRAHSRTLFPLVGGHARVDCEACHGRQAPEEYVLTPTDCYTCHRVDFQSATQPPHGGFSTHCQQCHLGAPDSWQGARFQHTGRFPLVGAHAGVACVDCHRSGYRGVAADCYSCHRADFERTRDPNHVASGFPTACQNCHGSTAWQPASFDHARAGFPLEGAHRTIACTDCHRQGYAGTPADCYSCHRDDYNATREPNHLAAGYPTTCTACHNTTSWSAATFDHTRAGFPLEGAHRALACSQCHARGYAGTPAECYACHQSDFQGARDPNHVQAGFPTSCSSCHSTTAWQPATFDHARSSFPLEGAHRTIPCADCHRSGYSGTPADCYSCHRTDYQNTRDPNHVTTGFPTTCQSCHGPTAWRPANFDHARTSFPLTGAHAGVQCQACHASGYTGTPRDCYSCHRTDYQNTRNPDHAQAGYPTACESCHTTAAWQPASFNHNSTDFPLTGAHTTVECQACHASGYAGTPRDCYSCHRTDYQNTRNPNHAQQGYPTTCESCHTTAAWQPANFNHNTTGFPLTGAHTTVECQACHASGYAGTPTDCYSCHRTDFDNTHDPDHRAAGFPTTCETCHSTTAWEPSTFDHSQTGFPLTGAHTTVACVQCHAAGYDGTPSDCYSCHRSDYEATRDPNHVAQGYPTTCQSCHTTSAWEPATFDHDAQYFPIYSGAHRGTWSSCSTCHTVASDYSVFSCIGCHEHDRSRMDSAHHDVGGYHYDSAACYSCHPDGRADD